MLDDNAQALPDGFQLNELKVQSLVGAGTFGYVYRCTDRDGDIVAVREYLPRAIAARTTDGEVRPLTQTAMPAFDAGLRRFVERGKSMQSIRHPSIVRVIDVFLANGTAYASMDLVTGDPLTALLGDDATLRADLLARYFGPVVDGVAAMHRAGVVHGNIGPGSIIVRDGGVPVLLGLAVPPSDEFGAVAKPGYAPIEHYSASARFSEVQADVYALGAVLYRCMTGLAPPEPPVRIERDRLVPAEQAARGRYHPKLLAAVDASLAVQPDDRPAGLDDLRAAIAHSVSGASPSSAAATEAVGTPRRRKVSRPVVLAAAAALAVTLAGGLAWRATTPETNPGSTTTGERPPHPAEEVALDMADNEKVADSPAVVSADAPEPPLPADEPETGVEPDDNEQLGATAGLAVDTIPPGAEVVLRGVVVGQTPVKLAGLPPGTIALTLRHPHYEPLALDDITLSAGENTRLQRELVRATGSLRVTTTPTGAWVALDGRQLADATPALIDALPAGSATVTVGADDYETAEADIVVPAGGTANVELTLDRAFGTLTLTLSPEDAEVTLLDASIAYSPGVRLAVGAHRIRIAREGFETLERIVDIDGDAGLRVELDRQTYPFTVVTSPPGAAIGLGNDEPEYIPGLELPPGEYQVSVALRGYAPWNGTVKHGTGPTMYAVALQFVSAVYADPMESGGTGPSMAVVPAGSFQMGCRASVCASDELPVRTVTFEMPFAIATHEVTFEQFDRFVRATGHARPDAAGWGRGRRPVINVSWDDANAYAAWLSSETGRHYALPSEAEWEYAARSGTATAFAWGDTARDSANCSDCGTARSRTVPVGSFPANDWGLHDMHGNVWEWVQDCWNDSYAGAPSDGSPWLEGECSRRLLRGGSWFNAHSLARSASRLSGQAAVRGNIAGFRVTARDR